MNTTTLNTTNIETPKVSNKVKETLVELASVFTMFAATSAFVLLTSLAWVN